MFTAHDDRDDGMDLPTVRYGTEVVIARVRFELGDRWSQMVPWSVTANRRERTATGFVHEVTAVTTRDSHPVEVALRYEADGAELLLRARATARGSFTYSYLGLCIFLPLNVYCGRSAAAASRRAATRFTFPVDRTPDPLAFGRPFDQLRTSLPSGAELDFSFVGAEFALEDRRNSTDASYVVSSTASFYDDWPPSTVDGQPFTQQTWIRIRPVGARPGTAATHQGA